MGADASHAWVSVFAPDIGWTDFDPTNDLLPSDEHVTVANQAVQDAVKGGATQAQGIQLAIAALLEAAHTCE